MNKLRNQPIQMTVGALKPQSKPKICQNKSNLLNLNSSENSEAADKFKKPI